MSSVLSIPARPLYQGVRGSVWDPETSRERVGDWGGPETVWALLCVAERRATRPSGEWGYRTRRHMLEPSAQRRCHPTEALYVPTFSHLLIVNKLLSLSLSLSLSRVWVDQHVNIYITMNPYFQPAGAETTETDVVALSSRANPLQRHQKREEPS